MNEAPFYILISGRRLGPYKSSPLVIDVWYVTCDEWDRLGIRASFSNEEAALSYMNKMTNPSP